MFKKNNILSSMDQVKKKLFLKKNICLFHLKLGFE